ncbi:Clathrin light chain [Gracilaria domingensis]|nr:Clathrin light chain [Gracilaria domingensis]
MDEDFFKDYPPVENDDQNDSLDQDAADAPSPDPLQAFVLGGPDDQPAADESQDEHYGNGGPPPPEDDQPECPAVTEWRASFAKRLQEKVENERSVKAEKAERAKNTLETMHARWKSNVIASEEANKKKEREFIMQRDGVISRMSKRGEPPNWEIIPHLVDMTGKYKEGARDTSRMRQVLLRMKSN